MDVISAFARHRVAPDVLMLIVFVAGIWTVSRINIQFFPTFDLQYIAVGVTWPGASAEDVKESVVEPLENKLRGVTDYKEMTSVAKDGYAGVYLEFPDEADINESLDQAKQLVDQAVADLPSDVDPPSVREISRFEDVARIAVYGPDAGELRGLARVFENELLELGIGDIDVTGIVDEEIQVLVDDRRLIELGLTMGDISRKIALENRDASAGRLESGSSQYQLRTLSRHEDLASIADVPVKRLADGTVIRLRDVATVTRRPDDNQGGLVVNGRPAVELQLKRNLSDNVLEQADIYEAWMAEKARELPPSIELAAHDRRWVSVKDRLQLLLKNGALGLVLVILVMFLFLSGRVALWIAVGIPIAFMACLTVFGLAGGTINMISMFALIMATGIIVDDSIIVGENFLHRVEHGEDPLSASVNSAKRMFVPIFASSMTTIASFIPLFVIGGIIGSIIGDIPFIIVCVMVAALLECFLVLPGHLYASHKGGKGAGRRGVRHAVGAGFDRFRERVFRPLVTKAVEYRGTTVVTCVSMMALSIGLMANGFVRYSFFPGADLNTVNANVEFVVGTPDEAMVGFAQEIADILPEVEEELGHPGMVRYVSTYFGAALDRDGSREPRRERVRVRVELVSGDERDVSLREVSAAWRAKVRQVPEIESLVISGERAGPPGNDIAFEIRGQDIARMKQAAVETQTRLINMAGVLRISDDLPYGKQQLIFSLTPHGRRLGLDISDVTAQLRDGYDGSLAQTFTEGVDEVEVRVMLADEQRLDPSYLLKMPIRLPGGEYAPLGDLVSLSSRRSFDTIQHINGMPAIRVNADIDSEVTSVAEVIGDLQASGFIREIEQRYDSEVSFAGKRADEQETVRDMQYGLVITLLLIFIILTWVFSSWSLPVVIMATIPFGIIGTIIGHWAMGLTLSILSFFGVFTLAGIIVNNSIVLISFFQGMVGERPEEDRDRLIIDASCLRLRPVLLTSFTTIFGLLPLVFETSTQAQFLIPMAVSIGFGLLFATLLILLFTPACLSYHQSLVGRRARPRAEGGAAPLAAASADA